MSSIQLYDYQIRQAELLKQGYNLNFSDVGTGKTFSGLEAFKRSDCTKLLVICLASKVADFSTDGEKIGLDITALNKGTKKNDPLLLANNMVSVSFESVWRLPSIEKWVNSDTFILIDESHRVKSRGSKVGFFVSKLAKKSGQTYLLTATPITNGRYEEYFQQLVIAKLIPDDWKAFKKSYIVEELQSVKVGGQDRYFNQIVGYRNVSQLVNIVSQHSVRQERPLAKDKQPLFIDYYVKKPVMYGKIQKTRVVTLDSGEIKEYDSTSSVYHALRQLSSGHLNGVGKTIKKDKLDRLKDLIEANNERMTIFYTYDSELKALKELVRSLKRPLSEYNGSKHDTTNFDKHKNGIVLVQYKSGSTGVNGFQKSSIGVFYSQPNGSTEYLQSVGRLNRIGQTKQPVFYSLICSNSVESKVHDLNLNGKEITDNLLGGLIS